MRMREEGSESNTRNSSESLFWILNKHENVPTLPASRSIRRRSLCWTQECRRCTAFTVSSHDFKSNPSPCPSSMRTILCATTNRVVSGSSGVNTAISFSGTFSSFCEQTSERKKSAQPTSRLNSLTYGRAFDEFAKDHQQVFNLWR